MTMKIVHIMGKIDLQLDSDTEYFGNGAKFQIGIRNRKKNEYKLVVKDASKYTVLYLLLTVRAWRRKMREKQARREARFKK
jgi:hypothetical protein